MLSIGVIEWGWQGGCWIMVEVFFNIVAVLGGGDGWWEQC